MTKDDSTSTKQVDRYIDQNLKRVFSALEDDVLPERFKALIDRLRDKDAVSGDK